MVVSLHDFFSDPRRNHGKALETGTLPRKKWDIIEKKSYKKG
jgi:predicted urease superfamily metal-dependent hydrolase